MIEIAIILSKVVESFIDALTGKLTDKLWTKLQGDPAKNAIKQALGSAIQMYAGQNFRLELAQPLLQENGPLTEPEVAQELTQIICFQHEPNYNLIGQRWRLSMENPPPWSNFTDEAKRLLEYFRDVLRETDVFRPVFDSKSLDAIAANATTSARSLTNIERQLTELKSLMASHFEELSRYFATAVPDIRNEILDYTGYIGEKTQGFVGRQFVFDAVTNFTEEYPRGYFIIHGNSGLGLTALAAEMVRTNGYVHHFNVRIQGICTAEAFLRNVCAQLIVRYKLNYSSLPDKATLDGGFLSQLLAEVSGTLGTNEKAIIVISALDDVDTQSLSPGTNILYLPSSLPKGIYIIGTGRVAGSHMKIACEYSDLFIGKDYPENIADVKEYIKRAIKDERDTRKEALKKFSDQS